MKGIIVVLIITISASFSFAEEISADQETTNLSIVQAIVDSLEKKDLKCKKDASGKSTKASYYNFIDFFNEDFKLTVIKGSQPAINIEKKIVYQGFTSIVLVSVATDKDFKVVTRIVITEIEERLIGKINTGTIVEPNYVDHMTYKTVLHQVCK